MQRSSWVNYFLALVLITTESEVLQDRVIQINIEVVVFSIQYHLNTQRFRTHSHWLHLIGESHFAPAGVCFSPSVNPLGNSLAISVVNTTLSPSGWTV